MLADREQDQLRHSYGQSKKQLGVCRDTDRYHIYGALESVIMKMLL